MTVGLLPTAASALCNANQQSCSGSYGVSETFFGTGGQLGVPGDGCSSSYCAKTSVGELTVGSTSSGTYQAHAGFNTNREVYIEFIVNTPTVDLGVLDPAETHVGTASFSVKTYLAEGYQVMTHSPGPQNGSHTMQLMSGANNTSVVGQEQFGMNLAANDCPSTAPPATEQGGCTSGTQFSSAPQQDPDSTFSFGYAAPGYDTPNQYQYNDNDVIAKSDKSSGTTNYTISYLFNISNVTPAGTYTMDQDLVATSTF